MGSSLARRLPIPTACEPCPGKMNAVCFGFSVIGIKRPSLDTRPSLAVSLYRFQPLRVLRSGRSWGKRDGVGVFPRSSCKLVNGVPAGHRVHAGDFADPSIIFSLEVVAYSFSPVNLHNTACPSGRRYHYSRPDESVKSAVYWGFCGGESQDLYTTGMDSEQVLLACCSV